MRVMTAFSTCTTTPAMVITGVALLRCMKMRTALIAYDAPTCVSAGPILKALRSLASFSPVMGASRNGAGFT